VLKAEESRVQGLKRIFFGWDCGEFVFGRKVGMEASGNMGCGGQFLSSMLGCSACSSSSSSKHPYHRHCGCAIHVLANGFKGAGPGGSQLKVQGKALPSALSLSSSGDRGMSKLTVWSSD
jgi:hypothetical protein